MTAQEYADREGKTQLRVTGFGVPYCVRASEARLYELSAGELVFPRGGEWYEWWEIVAAPRTPSASG